MSSVDVELLKVLERYHSKPLRSVCLFNGPSDSLLLISIVGIVGKLRSAPDSATGLMTGCCVNKLDDRLERNRDGMLWEIFSLTALS